MTPYFQIEKNVGGVPFSKGKIKERLSFYGFTEIADIMRFIKLVCSTPPDVSDFNFIRSKIDLCLRHHDNGSDYFIALREFASELDAVICIAGQ
ncbi:hypothetical protein ACQPT2_17130 [Erwinia amylovora]